MHVNVDISCKHNSTAFAFTISVRLWGWSHGKTGVLFLFFKLVETPSGFSVCFQMLTLAQAGVGRKWWRNGGWGFSDARQTLNSSVADFSGHRAHWYTLICMEMRGNHANACSFSQNSMLIVSLHFESHFTPRTTHPSPDLSFSFLTGNRCGFNYVLKYT